MLGHDLDAPSRLRSEPLPALPAKDHAALPPKPVTGRVETDSVVAGAGALPVGPGWRFIHGLSL